MRTRTATLGAISILLVLLLLGALTLLGPSSVPAGQRPLLRLMPSSFGDFRTAFDAGAQAPRLVLLLSPT
jgi:hypothetical protein